MNKWIIGVLAAVVILGGGYFLVQSMKRQAPVAVVPTVAPTTVVASPTVTSASPSAAATMQAINITGTEFAFSPSVITAKKGQEVKVTFTNNGKYPHNFAVAELGVKSSTIQPGQTTTVTFTPTKTGSFTFECTVPGHADKGMTGTITVQ